LFVNCSIIALRLFFLYKGWPWPVGGYIVVIEDLDFPSDTDSDSSSDTFVSSYWGGSDTDLESRYFFSEYNSSSDEDSDSD
jgi:hypothetical protein